MVWTQARIDTFLFQLQNYTNILADAIEAIREPMEGKGVPPADSPIVIARLQDIEDKLRQIAANKDRPLPVN